MKKWKKKIQSEDYIQTSGAKVRNGFKMEEVLSKKWNKLKTARQGIVQKAAIFDVK